MIRLTIVGRALLALALSGALPVASAQPVAEWEYLVVAYQTQASVPLPADVGAGEVSRSKVRRFADLGIPFPQDATELQRNLDLLGRFGWELVAVIGAVDEDRRLVFKRPYDEERSEREAERIASERAAILAAVDAVREPPRVADPATPELVDLDAVERIQATETRNERDAEAVRARLAEVEAMGFPLSDLAIDAHAQAPDAPADVFVRVTQDVTNAALVAAGEFRRSLALGAHGELLAALERVGLRASEDASCTDAAGVGTGRVQLVVDLEIAVDGARTVVATRRSTHCFGAP